MKKIAQKILPVFAAILMGLSLIPTQVFAAAPATPAISPVTTFGAEEKKVEAAILKGCAGKETDSGEGILCIVFLVLNIMNVLVGVLGIIGIVVVGIQYLTAGGNEEQVRKAKRRLFEIVIGLALYALIAALINWLVPVGTPSDNSDTSSIVTSIGA